MSADFFWDENPNPDQEESPFRGRLPLCRRYAKDPEEFQEKLPDKIGMSYVYRNIKQILDYKEEHKDSVEHKGLYLNYFDKLWDAMSPTRDNEPLDTLSTVNGFDTWVSCKVRHSDTVFWYPNCKLRDPAGMARNYNEFVQEIHFHNILDEVLNHLEHVLKPRYSVPEETKTFVHKFEQMVREEWQYFEEISYNFCLAAEYANSNYIFDLIESPRKPKVYLYKFMFSDAYMELNERQIYILKIYGYVVAHLVFVLYRCYKERGYPAALGVAEITLDCLRVKYLKEFYPQSFFDFLTHITKTYLATSILILYRNDHETNCECFQDYYKMKSNLRHIVETFRSVFESPLDQGNDDEYKFVHHSEYVPLHYSRIHKIVGFRYDVEYLVWNHLVLNKYGLRDRRYLWIFGCVKFLACKRVLMIISTFRTQYYKYNCNLFRLNVLFLMYVLWDTTHLIYYAFPELFAMFEPFVIEYLKAFIVLLDVCRHDLDTNACKKWIADAAQFVRIYENYEQISKMIAFIVIKIDAMDFGKNHMRILMDPYISCLRTMFQHSIHYNYRMTPLLLKACKDANVTMPSINFIARMTTFFLCTFILRKAHYLEATVFFDFRADIEYMRLYLAECFKEAEFVYLAVDFLGHASDYMHEEEGTQPRFLKLFVYYFLCMKSVFDVHLSKYRKLHKKVYFDTGSICLVDPNLTPPTPPPPSPVDGHSSVKNEVNSPNKTLANYIKRLGERTVEFSPCLFYDVEVEYSSLLVCVNRGFRNRRNRCNFEDANKRYLTQIPDFLFDPDRYVTPFVNKALTWKRSPKKSPVKRSASSRSAAGTLSAFFCPLKKRSEPIKLPRREEVEEGIAHISFDDINSYCPLFQCRSKISFEERNPWDLLEKLYHLLIQTVGSMGYGLCPPINFDGCEGLDDIELMRVAMDQVEIYYSNNKLTPYLFDYNELNKVLSMVCDILDIALPDIGYR